MFGFFTYKRVKKEMCFLIAAQLRKLRENERLSLEELSARTGISVEILEELESGKAKRIGHLYRLARYYHKKIKIEFL